jgi:hypothetical protein
LPAAIEVMSAEIVPAAQPAKTTLFAGGQRSDVRQNRFLRFWPIN